MSGHSKWAKLKHTKGATDAKKSKIFSRLANLITIGARKGKSGDPKMNFILRDAIAKARQENMPQENINRAIKRGTGGTETVTLEETVCEAYGPGGIALLIHAVTDNKNRTRGEIQNVLNKNEGGLGENGSVLWMFVETGKIIFPKARWAAHPELELEIIDAGAEDIRHDDETTYIYAPKQLTETIRLVLERAGIEPQTTIDYIAKSPVVIFDEMKKTKIQRLLENLFDLDDVEQVYTNAEF